MKLNPAPIETFEEVDGELFLSMYGELSSGSTILSQNPVFAVCKSDYVLPVEGV